MEGVTIQPKNTALYAGGPRFNHWCLPWKIRCVTVLGKTSPSRPWAGDASWRCWHWAEWTSGLLPIRQIHTFASVWGSVTVWELLYVRVEFNGMLGWTFCLCRHCSLPDETIPSPLAVLGGSPDTPTPSQFCEGGKPPFTSGNPSAMDADSLGESCPMGSNELPICPAV